MLQVIYLLARVGKGKWLCNPTATVSVGFVLVCSREVENAKVCKPMYGNGIIETEGWK